MKKLLAACLALVMACSFMTACDEKDEKDEKDSSSVSDVNNSDKDSSKDDAAPDDSSADDSSTDDSSADDSSTDDSSADDSSADDSSSDDTSAPDTDVSLTGNAETPLGETVGDEVEADTAPFDALSSLDFTGAFTFDVYAVVSSEGISMEMPIVVTSDGTNSYMEANVFGFTSVMLYKDGNAYGINPTNKVYYVEEEAAESGSEIIDDTVDISGFATAGENISAAVTVTINGDEYTRYATTIDDDDVFIYAKDNKLCYFADEEALMIINEISTSARTELLELPEGYTEVSADEYYNLMIGLDEEE